MLFKNGFYGGVHIYGTFDDTRTTFQRRPENNEGEKATFVSANETEQMWPKRVLNELFFACVWMCWPLTSQEGTPKHPSNNSPLENCTFGWIFYVPWTTHFNHLWWKKR